MSFWSPIRIDELCESYGSGKTFDQIAQEMGATRATIIGKWNRLMKEASGWTEEAVDALCDFLANGGDLNSMKDSAKVVFAQVRRALGPQAQ